MIKIPEQLRQVGFEFVLLKPKSKIPMGSETNWVKKIISFDDSRLLLHEGNVGIKGGGVNRLVIVDCDNKEVQDAIEKLIPNTFVVSSGGKGLKHFYFKTTGDDECKSFKVFDKDKKTLMDFQAGGKYVVSANSEHENGNSWKVVNDVDIATMDYKELADIVKSFDKSEKIIEVEKKDYVKAEEETFIDGLVKSCSLMDVVDYYEIEINNDRKLNCPFHDDTNASFQIDKNEKTGYCFGCNSKWNATSFIKKKEGCNFMDALDIMAKIKGVEKALKEDRKKYVEKKKEDKILKELEEENKIYTSCFIDREKKIIVEQVWDKKNGSQFCIYDDATGKVSYAKEYMDGIKKYVPNEGEEVEKEVITLPTKAEAYKDEAEIDNLMTKFVDKWLDAPEDTKKLCKWNTKKTWVYDIFNTTNYIKEQGDTGSGKSRALNVWGFMSYKRMKTTGAVTPAPLFRLIDKWRGTLVMDEADLKSSETTDDIIKVINLGFERGGYIMRCDVNNPKDLDFFDAFCPKILGTRYSFQDKATESRCITHICMATTNSDIPLEIDNSFYADALEIRNKLLMWRFKNYFNIKVNTSISLGDLEPRVKQIVNGFVPILMGNEAELKVFKDYIKNYQDDLIADRQDSLAGEMLSALHELIEAGKTDITAKMIIEQGKMIDERTGKPLNPRKLNSTLKSLGFGKTKSVRLNIDGESSMNRIIPLENKHLNGIFKRYGYSNINIKQKTLDNCDTIDTIETIDTGRGEIRDYGDDIVEMEDNIL